jgi:prepilin-type N-terminal cleavage/methylation domain-containing protein
MRYNRGFSLLELLMVVAIMALLGAAGIGYYRNYAKNIEITTTSHLIIENLKSVRSRAMAGEGGVRWGVHFVNGAADYYELYSTPTSYADAATVIASSEYLPGGITFSDPSNAATKDILFSGISGMTSGTTVSLITQTESATITVTAIGTVY